MASRFDHHASLQGLDQASFAFSLVAETIALLNISVVICDICMRFLCVISATVPRCFYASRAKLFSASLHSHPQFTVTAPFAMAWSANLWQEATQHVWNHDQAEESASRWDDNACNNTVSTGWQADAAPMPPGSTT